MIPTVDVTATIYEQDGSPAAGAKVIYTLSSYDIDGSMVAPRRVEVTANASGIATATLWPNSAGERSTFYTVAAYSAATNCVLFSGKAFIPDAANLRLSDLLVQTITAPAVVDRRELWFYSGADFNGEWTVLNPNGSAAALNGYEVQFVFYDEEGGTVIYDTAAESDHSITVTDNVIAFTLEAAAFASFTSGSFYELRLRFGAAVYPISYGTVYIQP